MNTNHREFTGNREKTLTALLKLVELILATREAIGHLLNDLAEKLGLLPCGLIASLTESAPNREHFVVIDVRGMLLQESLALLRKCLSVFIIKEHVFDLQLLSLCQVRILNAFQR